MSYKKYKKKLNKIKISYKLIHFKLFNIYTKDLK